MLANVELILADVDIFHESVCDGVGDVTSVKFCDGMNQIKSTQQVDMDVDLRKQKNPRVRIGMMMKSLLCLLMRARSLPLRLDLFILGPVTIQYKGSRRSLGRKASQSNI